jgi:hypothetical protein
MNTSQSKMASMLLESGVEDNEWIIKLVTSRVVLGLRDALSAWTPKASDELATANSEAEGVGLLAKAFNAEPVSVVEPDTGTQNRKARKQHEREGDRGAMV